MKFFLFVEGTTEKGALGEFFKRWLDPRLARPVKFSIINLHGVGNYFVSIRNQVEFYLETQGKEQIIAGIGLIDLSGANLPSHVAHMSAKEKVIWGKNELEGRVGHPKFRQYFAVHETEAWLLGHPEILPRAIQEALPTRCSHPETVNANEPPSKLLARLYQQHFGKPYKKVGHGKNLFLECDPNVVAAKCPHFFQMLGDLEQLAREALQHNH